MASDWIAYKKVKSWAEARKEEKLLRSKGYQARTMESGYKDRPHYGIWVYKRVPNKGLVKKMVF